MMEQPAAPQPMPEVTRLASMDDLDGLSAELDAIDLTLADLDTAGSTPTEGASAEGQPAVQPHGQSNPSSF